MGLGIHKDGSMMVYTIPLMGGADEKWEDNTWIVEHLYQQMAGMNVIEYNMCGNVLTHRTNGGQNNPFNWTFINK